MLVTDCTHAHKVFRSTGQLISEWNFDVLNVPETNKKVCQIIAQESKKWSNHKIKALHNVSNALNNPYNHM